MEINKSITTILILVITGLLVFLFVMPEYEKSQNRKDEFMQKQAEYNGKAAYYAGISSLYAAMQSRQEALAKIDSAVPAEFSLASITYFFHQKATETGSVIKSVSYNDALARVDGKVPEKKLRAITFSVNLLGNYQGLKSFLTALEKSSRIFEVTTISFTTLKDFASNAPAQSYDFKLQIKTYAY